MKTLNSKVLSKSRLMRGLQCDKSLYLTVFKPELETPATSSTQARFDEGNKIGLRAQKKFADGILIDAEYWDTTKSIYLTEEAIKSGANTLFEATFKFENFTARVDILTRKNKTAPWHIIEVKSSTKVKPEHITDVAIQSWVLIKSGHKADKFSVMHINNACIAPDLDNLFTTANITKEVNEALKVIEKTINPLKEIIQKVIEPKKDIGTHCYAPYECPFIAHCWSHIPTPSVFDIPSIGQNAWEFYTQVRYEINKLNAADFKPKQQKAVEVLQTGKRWIDIENIKSSLKAWSYPLYFLDFETIASAIPLYDNTSPYQQIPFQFSCHVWTSKKVSKLEHFEYLHQESSDPRPGVIKSMLEGLGVKGSIVSYNKAFEIGVIKELAEYDSKNKAQLLALVDRFVDPLPIFREAVYHPDFLGSFSIKNVAPALLGEKLSYEHLEVGDGSTAQAWAEQILKGKIKSPDMKKTVDNMLEYCRQDTMAMVELVK